MYNGVNELLETMLSDNDIGYQASHLELANESTVILVFTNDEMKERRSRNAKKWANDD